MYNLEQIDEEIFVTFPDLPRLFAEFEVWDFSERNIARLKAIAPRLYHLPVGTVAEMTRIPDAPAQDIDVLFYGSMTDRRQEVLLTLSRAGLQVRSEYGVYGAERDALIARSKIVLNLHKHHAQIFEIVRVSYLLANRKAVVSEISDDTEIPADLHDAIFGAEYGDIADACLRLIADDTARKALQERGYQRMMARKEGVFLRKLLNQRGKVVR